MAPSHRHITEIMRKRTTVVLAVLVIITALASCSGAGSKNPGGHSPEDISRAERQPPPVVTRSAPAPAETASATGGNYDGQQLFVQYCAACHHEGKNGPPLNGVFARRELPSGTPANDARVKETIKMGRAMMPAFTGVLNDDQVNAIVSYLHTI